MHFNELVTIHIVPMKMSSEGYVEYLDQNPGSNTYEGDYPNWIWILCTISGSAMDGQKVKKDIWFHKILSYATVDFVMHWEDWDSDSRLRIRLFTISRSV